MRRVLLTIEYDGSRYSGWQKQPSCNTIQGEIESAIFKSIGQNCELFGSGRTDKGVHALNQKAHFDLSVPVPIAKLPDILNNVLPADIVIKDATQVEQDFHARFSVKKKYYQYRILNSSKKNAFLAYKVGQIKEVERVPKSKKLYKLQVDVGEKTPRTIVSGIVPYYTEEELLGKQVVVVTNLKPAKLCGIESNGMLLAAGEEDVVKLLVLDNNNGTLENGANIH